MRGPWRLVALLGVLALGASPDAEGLRWPISGAGLSRGYSSGHQAFDFVATCGTPFVAVHAGVVVHVEDGHKCRRCYACLEKCQFSYKRGACPNNEIRVRHADGLHARYLHLSRSLVSVGDVVEAGQVLGEVGNVGWTCGADGCHLHVEFMSEDGKRLEAPEVWVGAPGGSKGGCLGSW